MSVIKKKGNKWVVVSESSGRELGTYNSKEEAVKRLRQVEYFKAHPSKSKSEDKMNKRHNEIMMEAVKQRRNKKNSKGGAELIKNEPHAVVKNPNNEAGKVAPVKVPTLKNTGQEIPKTYAAFKALSSIRQKIFASQLMEQLNKQKECVESAIELGNKLESDGLSAEEFSQLMTYTQQDILMQLLQKLNN